MFLDITGSHLLFGSTEEIVRKIQRDILEELRLYVTVGIGDNPLLAKLALDNVAKTGMTASLNGAMKMFPRPFGKSDIWMMYAELVGGLPFDCKKWGFSICINSVKLRRKY